MRWAELSACLQDERGALELVAFRLEQQLLLVTSGNRRWLPAATAEVEAALSRLEACDRRRAELAAAVGQVLGLGPTPTLAQLAEASGEAWCQQLRTQRAALLEVLGGVQELLARNREVIARHLAATADALAALGVTPATAYGPGGAARPSGPLLLDTTA